MEIAHVELCRQQTIFLYEEFVNRGIEWANEIRGTKVVHGPLRRIEHGSIDSKKFGHKRIRWCTNSDRLAKAWNSQKPCCICENERSPVETKLILEAVKGEMLKDKTFSELDLKFAASRGTCQH